jgi:plasmid stabilization system protein ParE
MAVRVRRVIWLAEAREDLRSVLSWLRRHNRKAAIEAEIDILDLVFSVANRPLAGREIPSIGVRTRSLTRWHRRMAYRIVGDGVEIISLKDARQDIPN